MERNIVRFDGITLYMARNANRRQSLQILQKWVRRVGVLRSRDRRIGIETMVRRGGGRNENGRKLEIRRFAPEETGDGDETVSDNGALAPGCNSSLAVDL